MARKRTKGEERVGKMLMEGEVDRLRQPVHRVVHEVMEEEVEAVVGDLTWRETSIHEGYQRSCRT